VGRHREHRQAHEVQRWSLSDGMPPGSSPTSSSSSVLSLMVLSVGYFRLCRVPSLRPAPGHGPDAAAERACGQGVPLPGARVHRPPDRRLRQRGVPAPHRRRPVRARLPGARLLLVGGPRLPRMACCLVPTAIACRVAGSPASSTRMSPARYRPQYRRERGSTAQDTLAVVQWQQALTTGGEGEEGCAVQSTT